MSFSQGDFQTDRFVLRTLSNNYKLQKESNPIITTPSKLLENTIPKCDCLTLRFNYWLQRRCWNVFYNVFSHHSAWTTNIWYCMQELFPKEATLLSYCQVEDIQHSTNIQNCGISYILKKGKTEPVGFWHKNYEFILPPWRRALLKRATVGQTQRSHIRYVLQHRASSSVPRCMCKDGGRSEGVATYTPHWPFLKRTPSPHPTPKVQQQPHIQGTL